MTDIRILVGLDADDASQDDLLSVLLEYAEDFARRYCHLAEDEAPPRPLLVRMAAEEYGRLDGAGLLSRTVSGAAERYLGHYSDGTLAHLRVLRHPAGRRVGGAC